MKPSASLVSRIRCFGDLESEFNQLELRLPQLQKPYQNYEGQIFRFQRRIKRRSQPGSIVSFENLMDFSGQQSPENSSQLAKSPTANLNKSNLFHIRLNPDRRSSQGAVSKGSSGQERLFSSVLKPELEFQSLSHARRKLKPLVIESEVESRNNGSNLMKDRLARITTTMGDDNDIKKSTISTTKERLPQLPHALFPENEAFFNDPRMKAKEFLRGRSQAQLSGIARPLNSIFPSISPQFQT